MANMSLISIYDIESASWYSVTATGAIPDPRAQFCGVVSASPDKSSFQVTIFGGWDVTVSLDRGDVFVLTVPSFRWIKINALNDNEAGQGVQSGRAHHRCTPYKDAQMIVTGGSVRVGTADIKNETACKNMYAPIRVLNTANYTWQRRFDPSLQYSVPSVVSDVIGGK